MRRTSRRTQTGTSNGEQGFWPSYTDMMSAVALILFFLMLLAYIQNIITNNDLSHKEEELRDTLNQLIVATQQVKDKEAELQTVSDNLETAQQDLDQQKITLDQQASSIIEQANFIMQQQADIAAQKDTGHGDHHAQQRKELSAPFAAPAPAKLLRKRLIRHVPVLLCHMSLLIPPRRSKPGSP